MASENCTHFLMNETFPCDSSLKPIGTHFQRTKTWTYHTPFDRDNDIWRTICNWYTEYTHKFIGYQKKKLKWTFLVKTFKRMEIHMKITVSSWFNHFNHFSHWIHESSAWTLNSLDKNSRKNIVQRIMSLAQIQIDLFI